MKLVDLMHAVKFPAAMRSELSVKRPVVYRPSLEKREWSNKLQGQPKNGQI